LGPTFLALVRDGTSLSQGEASATKLRTGGPKYRLPMNLVCALRQLKTS
jgi:hypothetical protein